MLFFHVNIPLSDLFVLVATNSHHPTPYYSPPNPTHSRNAPQSNKPAHTPFYPNTPPTHQCHNAFKDYYDGLNFNTDNFPVIFYESPPSFKPAHRKILHACSSSTTLQLCSFHTQVGELPFTCLKAEGNN
ncbi:unnamed protein product [Lepeophtheirus salmonis]|uniref:(salmon louse) hypothetical protein n=1 Tax=Lepeophtheirus salmonis TaxID=72036 RepID=A0A7R8D4Q7_LEPSM|nr:unnamed protein product [Lepeophtheirus salmonis]CAF3025969.1 unnamed protein product [Lepeophtheirus salmonis]